MANKPAKGRKTPAKSRAAKPKADADTPKVIEAEVIEVTETVTEPDPVVETLSEPDDAPTDEPSRGNGGGLAPPVVEDPVVSANIEPQKQGSGFLPLVLGGLIAGGIGYGAAYITRPSVDPLLGSKVTSQAKSIADLQDQLTAMPVTDPAKFEEAAAGRADLGTRIDDLDARLAGLLTQPAGDGSLSAANIAAYQQELETLRSDVENLRGTAVAELDAARATAASIEENAQSAARSAAGRAALARVQGAIETGAPMGAPLDELAEALQTAVPDSLTIVRDGTPTLANLQAGFPDVARDALNTARAEGVSGEAEGGFTAFLRNQFSVRSTAPQEGDTADAILSRAQSAVSNGRLNEALSEVAALPEVARAPLSEWVGLAEIRVDAMAAAAALTEQLNAN